MDSKSTSPPPSPIGSMARIRHKFTKFEPSQHQDTQPSPRYLCKSDLEYHRPKPKWVVVFISSNPLLNESNVTVQEIFHMLNLPSISTAFDLLHQNWRNGLLYPSHYFLDHFHASTLSFLEPASRAARTSISDAASDLSKATPTARRHGLRQPCT
jgi:hypothetical protein